MKVKIISASKGTFWYVNQIGSTFTVKIREEHPADYVLDENTLYSTLLILKSDCEVIEEPTPQPEPFDLERAKKGEVFYSKDGFTRFKVVALSSFNDKLHIVETVRNGNANVEMLNLGVCSPDNNYMAPKEPEYVEGWVVVTPSGISGTGFATLNSAQKSVGDNTWKIEKIRFPKP